MQGNAFSRLIITLALACSALLSGTVPCHAAPPALQVLTENLAPFNYIKDNTLHGACADIVRELIRRTNTDLPRGIRVLPWSRAMAMAKSQPNVALFSTVRSPERERLFHWVGPIYESQVVLFKRHGTACSPVSLEQAKQFRVGVLQDYYEEELLRRNGFPDIYSVPGVPEQIIYLLARDRVDLWLQSWASGRYYAHRAGKPRHWLEVVLPVQQNELFIAFSKDTDPDIIARWQSALDSMRKDGSLHAIVSHFEQTLAREEAVELPVDLQETPLVHSEHPLP